MTPATTGASRPPTISVLLITVVLLPVTILAAYPIARLLPWGWECGAIVEVPTSRPGEHGGMAEFHIVARGTGRYDRARLTSAYVVYSGVERPGSLKVDLVTMTYRLRLYGYEHIPSRPLTLPAVEEYISRAALDPATAEGARVARGVLEELQNLANGIHPPDRAPAMHVPGTRGMYHGMAGTSHLDPGEPFGPIVWLPWYWPVCLPVWLAASLLIGRGIFRRHRRLTAGEVRAGAQASYCPVSQ